MNQSKDEDLPPKEAAELEQVGTSSNQRNSCPLNNATDESHSPNLSSIRKRSRPRQEASSVSDSEPEIGREIIDYDYESDHEMINTSDDIGSTSSSNIDDYHLQQEVLQNEDSTLTTNQANQVDVTPQWTTCLCKPVNTRQFQCLKWLSSRSLGFHPRIPDGSRLPRMNVQSSAWMIGRWELSHTLDQHEGCVNAVSFNESGSRIASGSDDLHVIVWDWMQRRVVCKYDTGHTANVFQSKFLPYSCDLHIVSCARDGQVRLATLSTSGECRETRRLGLHHGSAHKISLDPYCPYTFYSCGEDSVVNFFDVREEKPIRLFSTREKNSKVALYSIHSNPTREYEFLTSGRDQFIRTYDRRYCSAPTARAGGNDRPAKKFCPPHLNRDSSDSKSISCAVYSMDGSKLIGSYNDDDIYLFSVSQNDGEDAIQRFQGHKNYATVKGVNFYGPHSEYVVSGSDCGNVFIWETDTANVVNVFHGDEGGVVNVLEPHPHDPILATSGLDNDVKIWAPKNQFPLEPADLSEKVAKLARNNAETRRSAFGDDDSLPSIAWFLMEALQRRRRRHLRGANEEEESDDDDDESAVSTSSDDDDSSSTDDDEDVDGGNERRHRRGGGRQPVQVQCAQS